MDQDELDFSPGHDLGWPGQKIYGPNSGPVQLTVSIEHGDWEKLGSRAHTILATIIPEFVGKFVEASAHYGDTNADVLGIAGQFGDIWRKIGPLKRALWEGKQLTREQPREILMDLIGHALLTIEMLDRDMPLGREPHE